jgi:hypothetical protein
MKFNIPKRYDADLAENGVWFNISDENGNQYGEFKCRFMDTTSQRTELALKRIRTKYASEIRSKKMGDWDSIKVVMAEGVLIDWKMKDDKGKDIPFSIEAALEYFSLEQTRWVLLELGKLADNVTNFAALPVIEDIEKN